MDVEAGDITGVEVTRFRLSGSVVTGVGMLEYFETQAAAMERRDYINLEASGARLDVEEVTCLLDEDGEVLAEIEK